MEPTRGGRAIALVLMSTVVLAACGNDEAAPSPSAPSRRAPSATPTPALPGDAPAPVIVQIENSPEGRPQSGLSSATAVYEYLAEGGITRFSVLFARPPTVRVGPVRSARLATLELLRLYQGVLVYSGASTYIQHQLDSSGLKAFDEDTARGDLFRIGTRVPPHNLYTDGSRLEELLGRARAPRVAYPTPASAPAPPVTSSGGATPGSGAAPAPLPGRPAGSLSVPVSPAEQPRFTWDASLGGYVRHEPTGTVIDANTGDPVVIRTLVVQQVDIRVAPEVRDVAGELGVRHTLLGTGQAQVFRGGSEYDATWTQPVRGPAYLTSAGGVVIHPDPGLIWICLVPTGSPALVR